MNKNINETKAQTRTQHDANKKTNNRTRRKHEHGQITKKKKELDRIEPISRAEALIPDDVILTRSRSLDTDYGDLDDATSCEGR
ncbi:hypothetical protein GmHk_01G000001 [Glycine max]|nr:hypothetical protein GmHk_01G000001 [Glycine max]